MQKLIIGIPIIVVILIAMGAVIFVFRSSTETDRLPQFIEADFIDLDQIYSISKFRSGSGHDFSSGSEECRSMKHYFNTQDTREKMLSYDQNNGIPPKPDGVNDISIYSPVNGKIIAVKSDKMPIGVQVYIRPTAYPDYTVRLFHIYLDSGVEDGSQVIAGQKIGVISQYQNTDIAITRGWTDYISYFEVLPDHLFANYLNRENKPKKNFRTAKRACK